jgi:hypothetical protein
VAKTLSIMSEIASMIAARSRMTSRPREEEEDPVAVVEAESQVAQSALARLPAAVLLEVAVAALVAVREEESVEDLPLYGFN